MTKIDEQKRQLLKVSGAGLSLSLVPAAAAKAKTRHRPPNSVISRPITDQWTFRQAGTDPWLTATVPGTVHTDLLNNKKIPDPFYRTNERDLQWIDKKDWEYRTHLDIDEAQRKRNLTNLVLSDVRRNL